MSSVVLLHFNVFIPLWLIDSSNEDGWKCSPSSSVVGRRGGIAIGSIDDYPSCLLVPILRLLQLEVPLFSRDESV